MKIAFVRGPFLNPWELQSYQPLAERHSFTAVGADWQFYRQAISIPHISFQTTRLWGSSMRPLGPSAVVAYNRAMSWTLGRSYGLRGLDTALSGANILHAAEPHFTMTYQCLEWKRRHGGALVLTVWENLPHMGELHPWRRKRKQQVLREADGFLAVTETTARTLRQDGAPSDRITVIPMSVDTTRFVPGPKDKGLMERLHLRTDDFVVLFIGRFVEEKGIADLLECSQHLRLSQERRVRFVFVGAGPLEPVLRHAQTQQPDQISIQPFMNYEMLPRLHQLADLFVLPSRPAAKWQEQFGYVLIESMACGKPIITTRTGSIPDVMGDAGVLVEPGQPEALGRAITSLISDQKARAELSTRALGRAKQRFDATRNATLIEKFYADARSRARPS